MIVKGCLQEKTARATARKQPKTEGNEYRLQEESYNECPERFLQQDSNYLCLKILLDIALVSLK